MSESIELGEEYLDGRYNIGGAMLSRFIEVLQLLNQVLSELFIELDNY